MSREVEPIPKTFRPPKTRNGIRKVSTKRASENRERRKVLHDRYGQFPPCFACPILRAAGVETGCNGRADDGHEILTRGRGGSIVDVDNVVPVGRRCHDWITTHPVQAQALDLVRSASRRRVLTTEEDRWTS